MGFDCTVALIWNDWWFVRKTLESYLGGKLCLKRGLPDMVLDADVVNGWLEQTCAHLHAVTSNFIEDINVGWILSSATSLTLRSQILSAFSV